MASDRLTLDPVASDRLPLEATLPVLEDDLLSCLLEVESGLFPGGGVG